MLKGTIIENSLLDKSILSRVQTHSIQHIDDWILHDVSVDESLIPELAKSLAEGPWYIHLWEPGKDDVTVIFKHKIFTIKFSDRFTWTDAVAYGRSIGIPDEQLDFLID